MSLADIRDQVWKLYATLPKELKDAFFSEETGNTIDTTCRLYDISDQLEVVVEEVGKVLLGITPLSDFSGIMQKRIEAEPTTVNAVSRDLIRLIFMPVKASLDSLFDVAPANAKVSAVKPEVIVKPQKKAPGSDRYREPME